MERAPRTMPHTLFVESNRSGFGVALIEKALDQGHRVTFVSFAPEYYLPPGLPAEKSFLARCHRVITMDTHVDLDNFVEEMETYGRQAGVTAVVATSDAEIIQASRLARRLGLFGTNPAAVERSRYKHLTRLSLASAGVEQPDFAVVTSAAEAAREAARVGYPCVLKAVDASDSEDVTLVSGHAQAQEAFERHFSTANYSRQIEKRPMMLIEEYVDGPLFSVEVIARGGAYEVLGITDRELGERPYFVELELGFPAEPDRADRLVATALDALRAVEYDNGAAHVELVMAADGPKIIEINPRLIGGNFAKVIERCRGIDIGEQLLALYNGGEGNFGAENVGAGHTRYLVADRAGRVIGSPDSSNLLNRDDVVECLLKKEAGDNVRPPRSNSDLLGRIVMFADSLDEARQKTASAASLLRYAIEPSRPAGGKHLVVVGSYTAALRSAHDLGFVVTHVNDFKLAETKHLNDSQRTLLLDLDNYDEVLGVLRTLDRCLKIDLLLSMQENTLELAAALADDLQVAGISRASAATTKDKLAMRSAMAEAGLGGLVPHHNFTESHEEMVAWANEAGYPLICKPSRGMGSTDVTRVDDGQTLRKMLAAHAGSEYHLEKFIGGTEHSVEALTVEGVHEIVAITDKTVSDDGRFVEMGHAQPTRLTEPEIGVIAKAVGEFLTVMAVEAGVTHTEIKLYGGACYIIESHTRPGGDRIYELTRAATGVDLVAETLLIHAGVKRPPRTPGAGAAVSQYVSLSPQRIESVRGVDGLAESQNVVMYSFPFGVGDTPPVITSSTTRHGYVMCAAADRDRAAQDVAAYIAAIEVAYEASEG